MSSKCVLYPHPSGCLAVVVPADCGLSVEEIARKDVPAGLPFLIVDRADLPQDETYAAAWTADFSSPHGHGIGVEAWWAEQAAKQSQGE